MTFLDDEALDGLRALTSGLGPGDVVDDRFELRALLGEGAMGRVFRAWDRDGRREVALKTLREARDRDRFEREVNVLATLAHEGVVRYVAHGEHDDVPYVVMEHLAGRTLAEHLRRHEFGVDAALSLAVQIALALAAVHEASVCHRDVKPSNILLVNESVDDVRLIDFGLARWEARCDAALTATGALVGTPGYMAPEQVRGETHIDGRADVFALGCVLFECLTGTPAFVADTAEQLFTKILLELTPLDGVPEPLRPTLAGMLAKDPSRRLRASEVVQRLKGLAVTRATPPARPGPRPARGELVASKYVIGDELGRGGMGVVMAAKHVELGTEVALKIQERRHHEHATEDEARFLREARAAARIESEHAVRVLDVGRLESGAPFIVMERLRGRDLAARLRTDGPLDEEDAVRVVLEACEALAEAHALGIVHRDLKPSNLFEIRRRDGTPFVKVLDFGISKLLRPLDDASLGALAITSESAVMGSAAYMSPEQLRATRDVDAQSDIWSLGVVLHELIAGRPPFVADSPAGVGALIATAPPPPLDAAPGLAAVVSRCLEKVPSARFADVGALAEALAPFGPRESAARAERIRRVLAGDAPPPPRRDAGADAHATTRAWDASSSSSSVTPPRQRRRLMPWPSLGVAALVATAVVSAWRSFAPTPPPPSDGVDEPAANAAAPPSSAAPTERSSEAPSIEPRAPAPTTGTDTSSAPRDVVPAPRTAASGPSERRPPPPGPTRTPTPSPTTSAGVAPSASAPKRPRPGEVDLRDPALQDR